MTISEIGLIVAAFSAGMLTGWLLRQKIGRARRAHAEATARQIIAEATQEAENLKQAKLLEVRDELFQKRQELEQEIKNRRHQLQKQESQLAARETSLDRKVDLLNQKKQELAKLEENLLSREASLKLQAQELDRLLAEENKKLEQISGLTNEEAKRIQLNNFLELAKQEAAQTVKEIKDHARMVASREARDILVQAIQRTNISHVVESTVSVVRLPNDDMKGRIIGREGRNIRSFEAATGIEVLIDDTPNVVMLSGFDPVRREIAKLSLEKLITDGRIHPGRIEEVVEKTRSEVEELIREAGEQAMLEVGLHGLHVELIRLLGKLKYRSSEGQNLLQHSIETALIAGVIAAEVGLESQVVKRGALLHEIGAAVERETDTSAAEMGAALARRYGENEAVENAILFANNPNRNGQMLTAASLIVATANEISLSRPGAQKETLAQYFQRMSALENIANSFPGVLRTYALQAGREIRVIVEHTKVDDARAEQMAVDIARKIQQNVHYPGQIRVTIVREYRAVDYAK
ncbi:MAG: ribonuclease Y [candidate division KSB1 bacterium]|nr:ribonuclease Y [candidate division KSB1 bacterium]MDZ7276474.1 ribonuclease Y [candidate division KSB1 bacterium]MDZ7286745.1 ribonuclease Y [candidate division KSB1 bacterium]MDZ7300244.1 ribonuclease Y [candidate division KSB1 bacterium]MDZ7306750.1 ribonuclease Y [candidate division KSB1 bacterium]